MDTIRTSARSIKLVDYWASSDAIQLVDRHQIKNQLNTLKEIT